MPNRARRVSVFTRLSPQEDELLRQAKLQGKVHLKSRAVEEAVRVFLDHARRDKSFVFFTLPTVDPETSQPFPGRRFIVASEVSEGLKAFCREHGVAEWAVIRNAIRQYFDL